MDISGDLALFIAPNPRFLWLKMTVLFHYNKAIKRN